ncbi:hypothetical protein HIM_07062 [Hirsutella minnesotensis 3608]|uniref:Acid phosphatase n=1 Tax=Hirsutella minnesotensis 3608 TaxID=1043627 RepID=A0A0F7ZI84_9HYPO|nr:hypothetical protein HIM_07062 [Hirsutella minnesotensis 3608]
MHLLAASVVAAVAGLAAGASCAVPTPVVNEFDVARKIGDWETKYTRTDPMHVNRAAETALTNSPTSKVAGAAFDRLAIIFFENTDFEKARGDRESRVRSVHLTLTPAAANFDFFAKKGITLTNYYGVTHPSQPNYMAAIAGDYFGMNHDEFLRAPKNISTVVDLLESKKISWGHYQENMPFSGFEGKRWKPRDDPKNYYVRKHNPAVLHDSVASSKERLALIKNVSMTHTESSLFHRDLANDLLPQWMFITPGMWSDGHDSDVTTAGEWLRKFLEPLLENKKFMKRTLVLITFDEAEVYSRRNRVLSVLLGDAVPEHLVGTEDPNYYNHYSQIATVSANWDLPTLGRWDVGANILKMVADRTGDKLRKWPSEEELQSRYWNESYAGAFHDKSERVFPMPNLALTRNSHTKRPILKSIIEQYAKSGAPTYYEDTIEVPEGLRPPRGYAPSGSR